MKKNPTDRIKELIPYLPDKDAKLADEFFKKRNFEGILELVRSDLHKLYLGLRKKDDILEREKLINTYNEDALLKLKQEITDYMVFLDVPCYDDDFQDYDDYY